MQSKDKDINEILGLANEEKENEPQKEQQSQQPEKDNDVSEILKMASEEQEEQQQDPVLNDLLNTYNTNTAKKQQELLQKQQEASQEQEKEDWSTWDNLWQSMKTGSRQMVGLGFDAIANEPKRLSAKIMGGLYGYDDKDNPHLKMVDQSTKELREWSDKGSDKIEPGTSALIGQLIPQTALLGTAILTRNPTLANTAIGTMYASAFGQGLKEYDESKAEQGEEGSYIERLGTGAAYGAAEYLAERLGLEYFMPKGTSGKVVGKVMQKLFKRNPKAATELGTEVLEAFRKQKPKEFTRFMNRIAGGAAVEGLEESLTESLQMAVDAYLIDKDISQEEVLSRLGEAFKGGALMGAPLGAASRYSQNRAISNAKKEQQNAFLAKTKDGKFYDVLQKLDRKGKVKENQYMAVSPDGEMKTITDNDIEEAIQVPREKFEQLRGNITLGKAEEIEQDILADVEEQQDRSAAQNLYNELAHEENGGVFQLVRPAGENEDPQVFYVVGGDPYQNTTPVVVKDPQTGEKTSMKIEDGDQVNEMDAETAQQQIYDELMMERQAQEQAQQQAEAMNTELAIGSKVRVNNMPGEVTDISDPEEGIGVRVTNPETGEETTEYVSREQIMPEQEEAEAPPQPAETPGVENQPSQPETPQQPQKIAVRIGKEDKEFAVTENEDGSFTVGTDMESEQEANKVAKAMNDTYPNEDFEVVNNTPNQRFARAKYNVVAKPKANEAEQGQDVTPEAQPETPQEGVIETPQQDNVDGQQQQPEPQRQGEANEVGGANRQDEQRNQPPQQEGEQAGREVEGQQNLGQEPTFEQKKQKVLDFYKGDPDAVANANPEEVYNNIPEVSPEDVQAIQKEFKAIKEGKTKNQDETNIPNNQQEQAAKEEPAKEEPKQKTPDKEQRAKKPTIDLTKKGKKKAVPKRIQKVLDKDPNSLREQIMQFILGGGRFKSDDYYRHTGFKKGSKEAKAARLVGLKKDGIGMDEFTDYEEDTFASQYDGPMDIINEIIDVFTSYTSRWQMVDALEKDNPTNEYEGLEGVSQEEIEREEMRILSEMQEDEETVALRDEVFNEIYNEIEENGNLPSEFELNELFLPEENKIDNEKEQQRSAEQREDEGRVYKDGGENQQGVRGNTQGSPAKDEGQKAQERKDTKPLDQRIKKKEREVDNLKYRLKNATAEYNRLSRKLKDSPESYKGQMDIEGNKAAADRFDFNFDDANDEFSPRKRVANAQKEVVRLQEQVNKAEKELRDLKEKRDTKQQDAFEGQEQKDKEPTKDIAGFNIQLRDNSSPVGNQTEIIHVKDDGTTTILGKIDSKFEEWNEYYTLQAEKAVLNNLIGDNPSQEQIGFFSSEKSEMFKNYGVPTKIKAAIKGQEQGNVENYTPSQIEEQIADYLLKNKRDEVMYDPELVINNFFNTNERLEYLNNVPAWNQRRSNTDDYKAFNEAYNKISKDNIADIVRRKGKQQQKPKKKSLTDKVKENLNENEAKRLDELRKKLRGKFNNLNAGLDPETFMLAAETTGLVIKSGARKFKAFARAMVDMLGDNVKPHLKALYEYTRRADSSQFADDMTSTEEVDNADIDEITMNIDENDVSLNQNKEENVPDRPDNGQRNLQDREGKRPDNAKNVQGQREEGNDGRAENEEGAQQDNKQAGGQSGNNVPSPAPGSRGNNNLFGGQASDEKPDAGNINAGRGNNDGAERPLIGRGGSDAGVQDVQQAVGSFAEQTKKRLEQQKKAESIPADKTGDLNNIKATLPMLLPDQHTDVLKAEKRFNDPEHKTKERANGKGFLFTNGTGTGKTFTGLGIIKRFIKQGKKNILIVVPSQPKVTDWIEDGEKLLVDIKALQDTKDKGEGVNITTYANFRANRGLLEREFDLVVYDESHRIMENKDGAITSTTTAHKMISNKSPYDAERRLQEVDPLYIERRKIYDQIKEVASQRNSLDIRQEEYDKLLKKEKDLDVKLKAVEEKIKEQEPALKAKAEKAYQNTKVVMLSATPFKSHFNLRYANGILFDWGNETTYEQASNVMSRVDPESRFFLDNFGAAYEWKYHRLQTKENRNDDAVAMQEVQFAEKLKKEGVMSGRAIESDRDYARYFPLVSGFNSKRFNQAFNAIYNFENDKYKAIRENANNIFYNHHYTTLLFENLKASMIIDRVQKHLDLGRKIVVFHRRREGISRPPFANILSITKAKAEEILSNNKSTSEQKEWAKEALTQVNEFSGEYADLLEYEAGLNYNPAVTQFMKAFSDKATYLNGSINKKEKRENIASFNKDDSGVDVLVVQEDSGKEGVSLHDVTGNKQRALINLSAPNSSITALQIEGRIYRIGNMSNAIFEYPMLGLDMEVAYFGQTINKRLSTTENLAIGDASRDLIRSFADGVLFNASEEAPDANQGTGGKEMDRREALAQSDFEKARLTYETNQKQRGKRDSRKGVDYFATPEPLGQKMMEWGQIENGEHVLEPSAGHGAIAMWAPIASKVTAIEPSFELYSKLSARVGGSDPKILNSTFEDHHIVNKYGVVTMNPPFGSGGKTAMEHIEKAFGHLQEGGRLIAIVPAGNSMGKRMDKFLYGENDKGKLLNPEAVLRGTINLPAVTFKQAGTGVSAKVMVIDKIPSNQQADLGYASEIDLTSEEDIKGLFDALENIEMPSRVKVEQKAQPMSAKEVFQGLKRGDKEAFDAIKGNTPEQPEGGMEYFTQEHTKEGYTMHMVGLNERVDREDFKALRAKAKALGGYYSRYSKGDVRPGFVFESEEKAKEFMGNQDNTPRFSLATQQAAPFYSPTQKALEAIKQEKGTPTQFKAMLLKNGAKPAELQWMDFDSQFANRKSITKQEVQEWLDQNKIEVEEVEKSDRTRTDLTVSDISIDYSGQGQWKVRFNELDDTIDFPLSKADDKQEAEEYAIELASYDNQEKSVSKPKYAEYQTPGGSNYKELLLTMPVRDNLSKLAKKANESGDLKAIQEWDKAKQKRTESQFKSSHFDEPNIVVHVRASEYNTPNERILMLQEIQSDWAQQGKKEGFKDDKAKVPQQPLITKDEIEITEGKHQWSAEIRGTFRHVGKGVVADAEAAKEYFVNWLNKDIEAQNQKAKDDAKYKGVPNMPFKKTDQWVNLALRRMMRYAAENGFDRIAWTTGEQQAERYDLSKQVDAIKVWKRVDGTYEFSAIKGGSSVIQKDGLNESELEENIGKELAKKAVEDLSDKKDVKYSGLDLKVGGEGMKTFYNTIIPKAANKLGKKYGAKVEPVEIDVKPELQAEQQGEAIDTEDGTIKPADGKYSKQMSLPVTDKMVTAAMSGLPMFRKPTKNPVYIAKNRNLKHKKFGEFMAEANAVAKQFTEQFGVPSKVVESVNDLPTPIKNYARRVGVNIRQVEGVIDFETGVFYIVGSNVKDTDHVKRVILHEAIGHYGIRKMLNRSGEFDKVMGDVYNSIPEAERKMLEQQYNTTNKTVIAEEYVAAKAEDNVKPNMVQRAIAWIKRKLRQLFNINYSDNDIYDLLYRARTALRAEQAVKGNPMFSTQKPQTQSPEFKKWFGDSKVVDENGEPLVVYHGTNADFNEFITRNDEFGSHFGSVKHAESINDYKFSPSRKNIMPVYLSIESPIELKDVGSFTYDSVSNQLIEKGILTKEESREILKKSLYNSEISVDWLKNNLISKGYDGIKYLNRYEGIKELIENKFETKEEYLQQLKNNKNLSDNEFLKKYPEAEYSFIAFEPTQIKSATGNQGTFDPNNPDIRFSVSPQQAESQLKHAAGVESRYYPILTKKAEKWRETVQDRMLSWKKTIDMVKERGGKVDARSNPYIAENLQQSAAMAQTEEFDNTIDKARGEAIADIINSSDNSITLEEIGRYQTAKHAPERNQKMRDELYKQRTAKMEDETQKREVYRAVYGAVAAGEVTKTEAMKVLEQFKKNAQKELDKRIKQIDEDNTLSKETKEYEKNKATDKYTSDVIKESEKLFGIIYGGWQDFEANDFVDAFEKKVDVKKINALWYTTGKATQFTLDRWLEDGFISPEEYKDYSNAYEYYVPLRGWAGEKADDVYQYQHSDINGKTFSGNMKAYGRKSEADNPIPFITQMAHSAIAAGNKNRTKRNALNLVRNNIKMKDLFRLKKIYLVENEEGEWNEVADKPAQELWDAGKVKTKLEKSHQRRNSKHNAEQHEIEVFENGEKFIVVTEDPRLAEALNGLNYLPIIKQETMDKMEKFWVSRNLIKPMLDGSGVRRWSQLVTGKNPAFIPVNFLRDLPYAVISQAIRKDGSATGFLKNLPGSKTAIHRHLMGKADPKNSELDKEFADFLKYGGRTGIVYLKEIQDIAADIEQDVKRMTNSNSKWDKFKQAQFFKKMNNAVDYMAMMSEDVSRFAVYRLAIEQGKSKTEAAYEAKQATVNFNRKGRIAPALSSMYAFANAVIQGGQNFLGIAHNNRKGFALAGGTMLAMGYMMAELTRWLTPDDDEYGNAYESLNPFVRHNYMVLPNPMWLVGKDKKTFVTIPLPHGFRVFFSAGAILSDVTHGQMTPGMATADMYDSVVNAFSPFPVSARKVIEGTPTVRPFVPTMFVPFHDITINKNFMDIPIYREPFTKEMEKFIPQYQLARGDVNDLLYEGNKQFHKLVGNKDWLSPEFAIKENKDGSMDVKQRSALRNFNTLMFNPSVQEYLIEYYTGGVGRFVSNIYKTGRDATLNAMGEDVEAKTYNMPVIRRLYKEAYINPVSEYYDYARIVRNHKSIKSMAKREDDMGAYIGLRRNSKMNELTIRYDIAEKQINDISGYIEQAPTDSKAIDKLYERRERIMKDFVDHAKRITKQIEKEQK